MKKLGGHISVYRNHTWRYSGEHHDDRSGHTSYSRMLAGPTNASASAFDQVPLFIISFLFVTLQLRTYQGFLVLQGINQTVPDRQMAKAVHISRLHDTPWLYNLPPFLFSIIPPSLSTILHNDPRTDSPTLNTAVKDPLRRLKTLTRPLHKSVPFLRIPRKVIRRRMGPWLQRNEHL